MYTCPKYNLSTLGFRKTARTLNKNNLHYQRGLKMWVYHLHLYYIVYLRPIVRTFWNLKTNLIVWDMIWIPKAVLRVRTVGSFQQVPA